MSLDTVEQAISPEQQLLSTEQPQQPASEIELKNDQEIIRYMNTQLDGISYQLKDGTKVNLKERVGDALYPMYQELVAARIELRLKPKKDVSDMIKIEQLEEAAIESGMPGNMVIETRTRGVVIARDWVESIRIEIHPQSRVSTTAGEDPHIFLNDKSHPKGLGYLQNQPSDWHSE